jgi:SAM-dependent methyltransferase
LLLVTASGAVSYILINFIHTHMSVGVVWAKLAAEGALFIANFALQRDFVFTQPKELPAATDWDRYYTSTPFTAKLTRKYTESIIIRVLKQFGGAGGTDSIVEIGGANSCFLDRIMTECRSGTYHVVDSNQFGLDLLRQRFDGQRNIILHAADCLNLDFDVKADVVFSIGLIEHFEPADTQSAIAAHFDLLKQGGIAIISYPTPTLLYRIARSLCEGAGLWKFPDERPLKREEVIESLDRFGKVVFEKTLWPLVFTQHMMVIRKP